MAFLDIIIICDNQGQKKNYVVRHAYLSLY